MVPEREEIQESRAVAAYLGLAVGDALGATVEFMTPREIHAAYGVHDIVRGGGWLRLRPGQVTDDTTMALALGQSILDTGYVDAEAAAQAFSDWMRDKPVDIGNTVRRGITHFRYSGETEAPYSEHDAGNGACMRTLPVALATLGSPAMEVAACSREQAHVTHNNDLSDAGTECVIAMVQLALQGASKRDLLDGPVRALTQRRREFAFRRRHRDNPTPFVVETLQAVLQAFFDTDDFETCLVDVVNRGGDADTTGAIAGMIAGSVYGLDAIPRHWLAALDRTVYRRCTEQAVALLRLSSVHQAKSTFHTVFGIGGARA